MTDQQYMHRCLQLALNGRGLVSPNPMVGAVVVHQGQIIGEGYHRCYGQAHAEVHAIAQVKDKTKIQESTLYVSLEPCAHYGKTAPCAQMIIDLQIPHVVISCLDPYPAVSGKGVQMLREAGIRVDVGILEGEGKKLNKEFFTVQLHKRPYIYLKWAESEDGFIDKEREKNQLPGSTPISNSFTQMLVHKKRAEVSAILVGTNTAVNDNPSLTTRLWYGPNPIRIVIDRTGRIPAQYHLVDGMVETLIFTEAVLEEKLEKGVRFIPIRFDSQLLPNLLKILAQRKINSLLVEGGRQLLQSLIDQQLWDEAYIEKSTVKLYKGTAKPNISGRIEKEEYWQQAHQLHLKPNDYK